MTNRSSVHREQPRGLGLTLGAFLAIGSAAFGTGPAWASNGVLGVLETMQANSWQQLNVNNFLDAAPPMAERGGAASGYSAAESVIYAWGSFAWDTTRSELLIFGGGHHNYAGNEMYKWSAATQAWSLASLPSQVTPIPGVDTSTPNWAPVDGAMNAPVSSHTYDNSNYLAGVDRFITLGGASAHSGGSFTVQVDATTSRFTGPYLFDPAKADGTKVGGTSGSGVLPGSVGGQMWQNRDLTSQGIANFSFIEGTSAAAVENGNDVVYFTARSGGTIFPNLYQLTISDLANPASDTITQVGAFYVNGQPEAPLAVASAGYDPGSRLYVAMGGGSQPFVAWDLDNAGPENAAVGISPVLLSGKAPPVTDMQGIDFDPKRGAWLIWSGGGSVWALKAPAAGTTDGQWTLEQIADDASFVDAAAPAGTFSAGGQRGKWHYAADLDAFIALEDNAEGNVWVFKAENWVNPAAVDGPGTLAMWLTGGLGLVGWRRWQGCGRMA